jgi:cyclophilin family peptidyl-prolyl cis-trans isomerase
MATTKRERQKAARRIKMEEQQRRAKRRQNTRRGIIVAIVAVLVLGTGALLFSNKTPTTTTTTAAPTTTTTAPSKYASVQKHVNAVAVAAGCPASPTTRVNTLTWSKAPAMTINTSATYDAHFDTTAGDFVVQLDAKTAPITTNNFVFLAEHKFYNCVIFQRVIPGFAIQGGDPTGTGGGSPGYTIADEYPKAGSPTYPLYSLAMANATTPHTGGSQFFFITGTSGESLPNTYTLFGQTVSGQSVLKTINGYGNTSSSANGVPPLVIERMLKVTITQS